MTQVIAGVIIARYSVKVHAGFGCNNDVVRF